jgi:hypothetical protein
MEQYAQAPASTESNLFELSIDHEISSHLGETAKWAKFLSIVGFVFMGVMLIVLLFAGSMISSYSYSPITAAICDDCFVFFPLFVYAQFLKQNAAGITQQ